MTIQLYRILCQDPGYNGRNVILQRKPDIIRKINALKSEFIEEYVSITDVLSERQIKQLIVVI